MDSSGGVAIDPKFEENRLVYLEAGAAQLLRVAPRVQQAAALHPETGQLWTVEHGARGGDELNHPEAGRNYGWPVVAYGRGTRT